MKNPEKSFVKKEPDDLDEKFEQKELEIGNDLPEQEVDATGQEIEREAGSEQEAIEEAREELKQKDEEQNIERKQFFTEEQEAFLKARGSWLEEQAVKHFLRDEGFEIDEWIWGHICEEADFSCTTEEFCDNVLLNISEKNATEIKKTLLHTERNFSLQLVEKLQEKGVVFFSNEKGLGFLFNRGAYYPERNYIVIREDIDSVSLLEEELTHAACYNLPEEFREEFYEELEQERQKLVEFFHNLGDEKFDEIKERYNSGATGFNLEHALSSNDELIGDLAHPRFVELLHDLQEDKVFPKSRLRKAVGKAKKIFRKEEKKFQTNLFTLQKKLHKYITDKGFD